MIIVSRDLHPDRKSNFSTIDSGSRDKDNTITHWDESTIMESIRDDSTIIGSPAKLSDSDFEFNLNAIGSDSSPMLIFKGTLGEAEDLRSAQRILPSSSGSQLTPSEGGDGEYAGSLAPTETADNLLMSCESVSLCDEASSFSMPSLEKKTAPYISDDKTSIIGGSRLGSFGSNIEELSAFPTDITATQTTECGDLKSDNYGPPSTPPRKINESAGEPAKNLTSIINFATPLAPISPYKTFKENKMERERKANINMNTSMSSAEMKLPISINKSVQSNKTAAVNSELSSCRSVEDISSSKDLSWSAMTFFVMGYICVLIASCCVAIMPTVDQSDTVSHSPWVGENNATKLIDQRLQLIQNRYQKVLVREDWKMLRMSANVTIETMSSEDGSWPGYIRTCAIFQAQPADILKHLGWLQYHETQKIVDRFHESAHLLFPPSHKSKVIRKTTQRPLLFPKREMTVALCEKTLKQSFTLTNLRLRTAPMKTFTSILIPKGTQMNAMVNVNVDLDALEIPVKQPFWKPFGNRKSERGKDVVESKKIWQTKRDRKEKHIKAYQDMMGWFVALEGGGTLLVFVMQVDLGPDIPHWAFFTAVAATAAWSMAALNKLSSKEI